MKSPRTKTFVVLGIALIPLFLALVALRTVARGRAPSAKPLNLAVAFLGFTNTPDGALGAVFLFTNGTPCVHQLEVKQLEYQARDSWHAYPLGKRLFRPLAPGYAFSDWFLVPTTNGPWRLRLACMEQAVLIDTAKARIDKLMNHRESVFISGRSYDLLSSTLGTSTEPGSAANRSQPVGPETNRTSSTARPGG